MTAKEHLRQLEADYSGAELDTVLTELRNLSELCALEDKLLMQCKKEGTTQTANSGYVQTAPWFTNLVKIRETILKQKQHLGFRDIKEKKLKSEFN